METNTAQCNYDEQINVMLTYGFYMKAAQENSDNGNLYIAAEQRRFVARKIRNTGDEELAINAATQAFQTFVTAAQYPPKFPQYRGAHIPPAKREDCLREALLTAQEFGVGEASQLKTLEDSLMEKVNH